LNSEGGNYKLKAVSTNKQASQDMDYDSNKNKNRLEIKRLDQTFIK
jgi:hypothetical protein